MATVTLPDDLAARVAPFGRWLPAVLELSLLGLKTSAREAADELVAFFVSNPAPQQVWDYTLAERWQVSVARYLEKNREGSLSQAEGLELDEFLALEETFRLIKARLAKDSFTRTLKKLEQRELATAYKEHAQDWQHNPDRAFWDEAAVDDGLDNEESSW